MFLFAGHAGLFEDRHPTFEILKYCFFLALSGISFCGVFLPLPL